MSELLVSLNSKLYQYCKLFIIKMKTLRYHAMAKRQLPKHDIENKAPSFVNKRLSIKKRLLFERNIKIAVAPCGSRHFKYINSSCNTCGLSTKKILTPLHNFLSLKNVYHNGVSNSEQRHSSDPELRLRALNTNFKIKQMLRRRLSDC